MLKNLELLKQFPTKLSFLLLLFFFHNNKANRKLKKILKKDIHFLWIVFVFLKSHNSNKTQRPIFFNNTAFSITATLTLKNLEELKPFPTKYIFVTVVLFYNNKANHTLKKVIE